MRGPHPQPGEARAEPPRRAFAPGDGLPSLRRQAEGEGLDRDRPMPCVAPLAARRTAAAGPGRRRQRPLARGPDCHMRLHPSDVVETQRRDRLAQGGVDAVAGVHQHDAFRNARRLERADLHESNLGLGRKAELLRHASPGAPLRILGPDLRQIEAVGDGQAGAAVSDRDGHRRLTVLLLAELAAILPGDADRMPSLLRKGGVIDNPGLDRSVTLERRRRQLADLGQHPLVRPRRLADEMQQRLMLSGGPSGAVAAAIGSTLLRSKGAVSPTQ